MLEGFNPAQRAAVEYCDGPSLVIAGAGSGKTRVLTYKIAYLMQHGYEPWQILALTFTNKAANEMKQRIAQIVGTDNARRLWMGTFHSIFLRILRAEHEAIGFSPNFTIYDSADSKSLVKAIIKELGLDDKTYKPGNILGRISNAKNQLVTAQDYINNPSNIQVDARQKVSETGRIYAMYANRCRQADAMDFDDILLYTFLLFEKYPEIAHNYAERFRYVLVDEYQDTNYAQHRIVWQLTKDNQHVCVVGDDAQSIYSFRGANIDNILTFNDIYDNSRLFKLEQNYRSTQTIVNAANSLICKNVHQIHKDVFSQKEVGDLISLHEAYSDVEEGQIVTRQIRQIRQADKCEYSDFAILYRTNAQSRVFEDEFRKNGLPYRIYGGLSFYQRKEIKDVIAYLRLAVNPNDEEAMKRVINYPTRGIGNTTLQKIVGIATANNTSLWNVISFPIENGLQLSKATATRVQEFKELIDKFIELSQSSDAENTAKTIMRDSGILNDIYQDKSPENLSRQENIEELLNGLSLFCSSRIEEGNTNISTSDYLSEVSLLSDVDSDKDDDSPKITLMTIHSAKGLEFGNVFVVGLEEGLFPSDMASGSPREIEEERRLFYVAITRAERRCFLSYAKSRYRYGQMEFGNPSRFLADIDPQYIKRATSMRSTSNHFQAEHEVQLPWQRSANRTWQRPSANNDIFGGSSTYNNRTTQSRPAAAQIPQTHSATNLRRLSPTERTTPTMSQAVNTTGLAAGKTVLHNRFGKGVIEAMEGEGDSLKAIITFENAGKKQLLIKFANLQLLN